MTPFAAYCHAVFDRQTADLDRPKQTVQYQFKQPSMASGHHRTTGLTHQTKYIGKQRGLKKDRLHRSVWSNKSSIMVLYFKVYQIVQFQALYAAHTCCNCHHCLPPSPCNWFCFSEWNGQTSLPPICILLNII